MTEPFEPHRTADDSDPFDAGMAAAFAADSGPPLPANGSVLQALGAPAVLLREPSAETVEPVLRPHTAPCRPMPRRATSCMERSRGAAWERS
jgi:hypothetical protein